MGASPHTVIRAHGCGWHRPGLYEVVAEQPEVTSKRAPLSELLPFDREGGRIESADVDKSVGGHELSEGTAVDCGIELAVRVPEEAVNLARSDVEVPADE